MDVVEKVEGAVDEEAVPVPAIEPQSQAEPQPQGSGPSAGNGGRMFTLKKWNAVAMWSWDVECDTCAICRVQVMDACLRCQSETKVDARGGKDCVVVWGECNHSFHQVP